MFFCFHDFDKFLLISMDLELGKEKTNIVLIIDNHNVCYSKSQEIRF